MTCIGREHYEEIFGVSPPPKKLGAHKLPILDDFVSHIFKYKISERIFTKL